MKMLRRVRSIFKLTKTKLYSPSKIALSEPIISEGDLKETFRILDYSESEGIISYNDCSRIITDHLTRTMEDIEFISPIPEDRYNDVILHLRNNFFADEPLNKSVGLCVAGEPHAELEAHSLNTLRDNLSVMAVDKLNDQVVAVSLNGIQSPGDVHQEKEKLEKMTDLKFKRIFTLLYDLNESLDLFSKYEVDRLFDARILSVNSNYRGKGLGKEVIRRAELVARENEFKVMKGDATGMFSQRIFSSLGWEVIHELKYADHVDEQGAQIFEPPAPHESLKIMIKLLN